MKWTICTFISLNYFEHEKLAQKKNLIFCLNFASKFENKLKPAKKIGVPKILRSFKLSLRVTRLYKTLEPYFWFFFVTLNSDKIIKTSFKKS